MLRVGWLLASLIVADAFVLPFRRQEPPTLPVPGGLDPTLLRMLSFYMPLMSMYMAFRSVDLMIKTGLLMQKMTMMQSIIELMLRQTPNLVNGVLDRTTNGSTTITGNMVRNSCALRLLCELTVQQRVSRRYRGFRRRMNVEKQTEYDEKINMMINITEGDSPEPNNSCERRYSGCPYGAEDIVLALERLRSIFNPSRVPRVVIPPMLNIPFFPEEEDIDEDYDYVFL